jgi:hypothetical protein
MYPARHHPAYELEYVSANSGLDEFDDESGEAEQPGPAVRALQGVRESSVFTVVEQYEPSDIDTPPIREPGIDNGRGPTLRLLRMLAMTVVLVAVPSRTPVGTEGLPGSAIATAARVARTDQAPPSSLVTSTPLSAPVSAPVPAPATSEPPANVTNRPPPSPARVEVPRARAETVSPPALESLREAFASLNGPFMSFEHCQVRLASADRAVARCQGIRNEAAPGESPPQARRVEWTLEFDRADQRWRMVDAAAR